MILHGAESSPVETTSWCPAVCDCYNDMETLDCSRRRLDAVPERLPPVARRVYLEDNSIGQLEREDFERSRRISELVLDRNRITAVDTDSFCTMTSLQVRPA